MAEKLLDIRKQVKKRKPTYKRVQSNQFAKLREVKWRRPKGMGNKVRRGRRGQASMPEVGYGSPKAVRGLNRNGLKEVLVYKVSDLENIDTKTDAAVIAKTVGGRKRLDIIKAAKDKNIAIANVKDLDAQIKKLTKEPAKKEKTTKKVAAKKEDKKEAKEE